MDPQTEQSNSATSGDTGSPISRIFASALAAGRVILRQKSSLPANAHIDPKLLLTLCGDLVDHRGEASGLALAEQILNAYSVLSSEEQAAFFEGLARDFTLDDQRIRAAMERYTSDDAPEDLGELRRAIEPRCNRLFRRLNMVPNATGQLVRMRGDLLRHGVGTPELKAINDDLKRLFLMWFNLGFLRLRRISWDSPASILEKFIEYEAVHEIQGWSDLRGRLKEDRRLFAYFHPAMPDDPIIFVQVALTSDSSSAIAPLVETERELQIPSSATTATFYSISNCHDGLQGISFGNFLIKQVAAELRAEFPRLKRLETLSPVPGFRSWLEGAMEAGSPEESPLSSALERVNQHMDEIEEASETNASLQERLVHLCAHYLVAEKRGTLPLDPVARFHLSNGAMLDRIHWNGDLSEAGKGRSFGIMVNYVYDPEEIENRHEAYMSEGQVATSAKVKEWAQKISKG